MTVSARNMNPDFANREAASIISLCRSLSGAPADLQGLIAAKLRIAWQEGRLAGVTACIAKIDGRPEPDEVPPWSADGFQPDRREA